jgi:hypothetical protein
MRLEGRENQTFMEYSGQAQVGGKIASVGQRLMDSAARSIIRQTLDSLNSYLKIEVAQQAPLLSANAAEANGNELTQSSTSAASHVTSTGEYQPPSQLALALNIARDVYNDLIPAKYRLWFFGAVALVILLVIWLTASR